MVEHENVTSFSRPDWERTVSSVIVRKLDGRIQYWNRASEKRYGWASTDAVGSVSHRLLNTVFPEPLDAINDELLSKGVWQGYLLHTLSDGSRVKVLSRWELVGDEKSKNCVVEVNENFSQVTPGSAHLLAADSLVKRTSKLLAKECYWWLISTALTILIVELFLEFTGTFEPVPLILP